MSSKKKKKKKHAIDNNVSYKKFGTDSIKSF